MEYKAIDKDTASVSETRSKLFRRKEILETIAHHEAQADVWKNLLKEMDKK